MQRPGGFHPAPSSTFRSWHPKATPYRLLVLGTTISVGTVKVVAVQEGNEGASTTLEWVSGVVIFLILHSLSTYDESPRNPPPLLGWLFAVDCMDYVWRFLAFFGVPRPSYSSEPKHILRLHTYEIGHTSAGIPVTLYRLLVCFITASFGLTKAAMTYSGYSAGANWIDWSLGTIVISILFILAMYENNTTRMWHAFFVPDHSTETQYGIAAATVALMTLLWLATCLWMMHLMISSPYSAFLSTDDTLVPLAGLAPLPALREKLFSTCFVLFMALVVVLSACGGVVGVAAILTSSDLPTWKLAADKMMGKRRAWSKDDMQSVSPGHRLVTRVAYHPISHLVFLLGCTVFLAFWIVSVAANVEEGYHSLRLPNEVGFDSGQMVFLAATVIFQICGAGGTMFLMWCVV